MVHGARVETEPGGIHPLHGGWAGGEHHGDHCHGQGEDKQDISLRHLENKSIPFVFDCK